MAYYLFVRDSDLTTYDENCSQFFDALETVTDVYVQTLSHILEKGIISGKKHDYLAELQGTAKTLKSMLPVIKGKIHSLVNSYLSDIDDADRELYDGSTIRDYSERHYLEIQEALKEQDSLLETLLKKAGYHYINGVLNGVKLFLPALTPALNQFKKWLEPELKKLIEENKETEDSIKAMFDTVHEIDQGGSGSMEEIKSVLESVEKVIGALTAAMTSANEGKWSQSSLKNVKAEFDILTARYDKGVLGLSSQEELDRMLERKLGKDPEKIKLQGQAVPGFEGVDDRDYTQPFTDVYNSMGQVLKLSIFSIDAAFRDGLKQLFGNDVWDLDFTYAEYMEMVQINATIEDIKNGSDEFKKYREDIEGYKELIEAYRKSGKGLYEYLNETRNEKGRKILDGRYREAREFRELLADLEKAEKIFEASEKGVEYLAILFSKRDQEQRIIKSLRQSFPEDAEQQKILARLDNMYNKKFNEVGEKIVEDLGDFTADTLEASLDLMLPVFDPIEKAGDATGLMEQAKGAYNAMHLMGTKNTARQAYANAVKAYMASDHDPELAKRVTDTYSFYQKTLERMYSEMAKATTGEERAYYMYCTNKVKGMSMAEDVKLMTFDEFRHQNIYEGTSKEQPVCGI